MRYFLILCLLIAVKGAAQTTSVSQARPQSKPAVVDDDDDDDEAPVTAQPKSSLPSRTPVITIAGVCAEKSQSAAGKSNKRCETVVSREDFEELTDAVQPGMAATKRQQFGDTYARFLVMEQEAKKRGLDRGERYHELLEFARAQILTEELDRALQREAANVSDKAIAEYYQQNRQQFERATFRRVFIPHSRKPAGTRDPGTTFLGADEKEQSNILRSRAVAGEDFGQLQGEAYEAAGLKGSAPTETAAVRPADLPAGHASVFALNPGQISEVITDSTGSYIYQMVNKEGLALSQVKEQIAETLRVQRMRDLMRKIQESSRIELNNAYFAPSTQNASGAGSSDASAADEGEASAVRAKQR